MIAKKIHMTALHRHATDLAAVGTPSRLIAAEMIPTSSCCVPKMPIAQQNMTCDEPEKVSAL